MVVLRPCNSPVRLVLFGSVRFAYAVKLEDGAQHKNHRVFSVSTGEELIAFSQKAQEGWDLQYTISESHAIRLVGADIQVYRPAEWSKGIADKLKVEGATSIVLSPGLNPSVAVFVAEKKVRLNSRITRTWVAHASGFMMLQGQPASIKIYALLSLSSPPTCQKSFFKADRAQIKWNTLGTQVLVLTQTEVDNSGKSYYGETGGFYLLSAAGNFDLRLTLDKEGGIHDFNWSPNSKEFGVIYGCRFFILIIVSVLVTEARGRQSCRRRLPCLISGVVFSTTSGTISTTLFRSTLTVG